MNPLSPWAATAVKRVGNAGIIILRLKQRQHLAFTIVNTGDSVWVRVMLKGLLVMAFRVCYSPSHDLEIVRTREADGLITLSVSSSIGNFTCRIVLPDASQPLLKYSTSFLPAHDLLIPFWPKDILICGAHANAQNTAGKIHVSQEGNRSGVVFFSVTRPKTISVFYFQNLSVLGDYCEQTETAAGDTVGGTWPELGFSLPAAKNKPLQANKAVMLTDTYVKIDPLVSDKELVIVRQYLDYLAEIYLAIPKPDTRYNDWPSILDRGLNDLLYTHGCFSHNKGHAYFNAYFCDYETPPEIMVQLAILLPLEDYKDWSGKEIIETDDILQGLSAFYNPKLKTIMRWLPSAEGRLTGDEEQKQPKVMDSWYLHHPMLNLSRMALKGNKICKALFINSLDYTIKVARHFKYKWPVFYNMETLEVLKEETEPGKGGEKDVAGLYAHVMLQAYDLTGEKRFLSEAKKAADTLQGYGFDLFYQANNTAFSAGALLRLYKLTGQKKYLDLSHLCIANLMRNTRLWSGNYGYGKNFPTFFAIYPLKNAPYTAAYEEEEVFCAMHDYLKHARGVEILPSVRLLLAEFAKYIIYRSVYYYPPMLPDEMIEDEAKTGEIDKKLWIALEDLNDGLQKSGAVGMEVYGAGNAFGILPRQYIRLTDPDIMVFCEYPFSGLSKSSKRISFHVEGDRQMTCKIAVVPNGHKVPASVRLLKNKTEIKGKRQEDGRIEFVTNADCRVSILLQN